MINTLMINLFNIIVILGEIFLIGALIYIIIYGLLCIIEDVVEKINLIKIKNIEYKKYREDIDDEH